MKHKVEAVNSYVTNDEYGPRVCVFVHRAEPQEHHTYWRAFAQSPEGAARTLERVYLMQRLLIEREVL